MKKLVLALVVVLGLISSLAAKEYTCTQYAVFDKNGNVVNKPVANIIVYKENGETKIANVTNKKFQVVLEHNKIHLVYDEITLSGNKTEKSDEYIAYKLEIGPLIRWFPDDKVLVKYSPKDKMGILYRCE